MKYVIITGASRGLGKAIVKELLTPNNHLICISRNINEDLLKEVEAMESHLDFIEYDLSNIHNITNLIDNIFSKIDLKAATSLSLVNNAGILDPIKPIERADQEEVITNIHVNLVSPMLLVSAFMKKVGNLDMDKRIINISSGAGKHPIFGWGCYGASKAGIDLFSQTVGMEQKEKAFPVKVVSFAPGIIDTDMQKQIRSTREEDFADVDKFIEYKGEGKLLPARTVAKIVVHLLTTTEFPNGEVKSINDYL